MSILEICSEEKLEILVPKLVYNRSLRNKGSSLMSKSSASPSLQNPSNDRLQTALIKSVAEKSLACLPQQPQQPTGDVDGWPSQDLSSKIS